MLASTLSSSASTVKVISQSLWSQDEKNPFQDIFIHVTECRMGSLSSFLCYSGRRDLDWGLSSFVCSVFKLFVRLECQHYLSRNACSFGGNCSFFLFDDSWDEHAWSAQKLHGQL